MDKNKNIFLSEFRSRPFAYTVQVAGIVIILLNVWLSTKLIPLAKSIDTLITRVDAAEGKITKLEIAQTDHTELLIETKELVVTIKDIQSRIERIDTRLSKHLGI